MPLTKKLPSKRRSREMRAECDFSGGVRGKYVDRYRRGTNVVLLVSQSRPAPEAHQFRVKAEGRGTLLSIVLWRAFSLRGAVRHALWADVVTQFTTTGHMMSRSLSGR
jgi:hypothetical protein